MLPIECCQLTSILDVQLPTPSLWSHGSSSLLHRSRKLHVWQAGKSWGGVRPRFEPQKIPPWLRTCCILSPFRKRSPRPCALLLMGGSAAIQMMRTD
jgi:hypothetical protein